MALSDLAVYLSAHAALKKHANNTIRQSLTAIQMPDAGVSGGTLQTVISALDEVPRSKLRGIDEPHWLSPGNSNPRQ
jgi:short subunit dehydrogenase-like uncharacterized protein